MPGAPATSSTAGATRADVVVPQVDGAAGRSTREVATGPTALETGAVLPSIAEVHGGAVPVPVPTADGDGAPADDRGPAAQARAVAGVLAIAAGQAGAHAAVRAVGEEATTRPQGVDDVGAGLPGRRRRTKA